MEIEKSFVLLTDNDEENIQSVLETLLNNMDDKTQLIIFDNMSNDYTIPIIIELIGMGWTDEKRYQLFINSKKRDIAITREKAISICEGREIEVFYPSETKEGQVFGHVTHK